ncbi:MAG: branched-chain amino acid aminotransferase [Chlorobi bacterium]|nr:branched-chain amino acid aminotransferase [Chlorobiota bacterium]
MDWHKLPFGYQKTSYNLRSIYQNGVWSPLEAYDSEYLTLHMAATSLHYGQEIFEGMKAFKGKDDKIRVFRWEENAKRFQHSAKGVLMPEVSVELFREAIFKVILLNKEYVPPYGTGASLYIRPLMIGTGAEVGVKPADEYLFLVFVTPVGPYFKEGFKPVNMMISREYDRAAPLGTGTFKTGGNYAGGLRAIRKAHEMGYANAIFLDAKEKKFIDECGPANFFGIKQNTYVTPESTSILNSITNKSLLQIAQDLGMNTERRKVPVTELETFEETGACGTAAVISPIYKIFDPDTQKTYTYGDGEPGPVSSRLYKKLTAIQQGDEPDLHNWTTVVE